MMTARPTLLVHIGDHKTGSSFLQSCFAASVKTLAEAGIRYPEPRRMERIAEGSMSFGNAAPLMPLATGSSAARRGTIVKPTPSQPCVLYSAEILFVSLVRHQSLPDLVAAAKQAGFEKVRILLFIRDPVGHFASLWAQAVKKGGNTQPIDDAASAYTRPRYTARFLETCDAIPDLEVTVRNYSVVRKDLRGTVAEWLGVPVETVVAPPVATVNRSLTPAEIELQLALNRTLGRNHVLANALCEGLPDVRGAELRPSIEAQELIWERMEQHIEAVNARVEPAHRYRRDVDSEAPSPERSLDISAAQLRAVGESLGREIARLRILVEGDLDLLATYVESEENKKVARRFVKDFARKLRLAGETEKSAEVRRLFADLLRGPSTEDQSGDAGAPVEAEAVGPVA